MTVPKGTNLLSAYYLRENIIEKEYTDEISGVTFTYYEYEEAKLTKDEYQKYLKELETKDALQTIEDLKTENQNLSEQVSMLTECILEMSEVLYA